MIYCLPCLSQTFRSGISWISCLSNLFIFRIFLETYKSTHHTFPRNGYYLETQEVPPHVENALISPYYGRVHGCGNCKKTEPNLRETSDTLNSWATARNRSGRNGSHFSARISLVLTKTSADFLRERISVCRTQERSRTKRSVGPLASASRSSAFSHFAP